MTTSRPSSPRTSSLRLVFLGSPPFAERSFAALAEGGFELVGLVTAPPRRAGRGRRDVENRLVTQAEAAGVPVLRPTSARDLEFQREFAALQPDLGVVVSFGQILDDALLAIARFGCVNIHGSLLPRWRGASPVQAAMRAGDSVTGVSLQRVVRELDAGAVLAEREVEIGARVEAPELFERLSEIGAELLVDALRDFGEGPLPAGREQDVAAVTHCRKIRKEDGVLDWSADAADVDRLVRSMAAWPCAQSALPDGTGLKIHRGRPGGLAVGGAGTVVELAEEIGVICGDGNVYLVEELQKEGRARMGAQEFLRGTTLQVGDRFGLT